MRLNLEMTFGTHPEDGKTRALWIVDIEPTEEWERTAFPAAGVAPSVSSWTSAEEAKLRAEQHVRYRIQLLALNITR